MALTLSANEQSFVRALARMTGLNTRTLQGWVAQEEGTRSHPLGAGGSDRPDYNFLNVGVTDSGPLSLTRNQGWKTPVGAAQETAAFLKGQKYGPSSGIRQIIGTRGQSIGAQIKAIQNSGWASGGETSLAGLVGQTQGLHNVGAPGPAQQSHGIAHMARAAASPSSQAVEQPQGLADLINALQSTQQAQGPQISSFNAGPSRYLPSAPTPGLSSSGAQQQADPTADLTSLIANRQTPSSQAPAASTTKPKARSSPSPTTTIPTGANPSALPKGTATFRGTKVAAWIAPILQYAASKGWQGNVNSGFRTLADQTRIYNSGVRPAARPGTSNHEFTAFPGGAVDVSNAQQLSQILQGTKYAHLLVWAGGKDPVHFSHPHNGSY